MARAYQHEEFRLPPRGSRVRTVTTRSGHKVRLAFPRGRRRRGSGKVVSVLHPKGERKHNPVRALTPADVKAGRVWYLELTDRFAGRHWFQGPYLPSESESEAHEWRRAGVKADSIAAPTGYQAKLGTNPASGYDVVAGFHRSGDPFVASIRAGDRVTIISRFGQQQTGRAVMPSGDGRGWVLNLGGVHGTPGLAYPENTVRVKKHNPGGPLGRMRELARSASIDAANRSMRAAGRKHWNEDDYNAATREFNCLWPEEKDKELARLRFQGKENPGGVLAGLDLAHEFGIHPERALTGNPRYGVFEHLDNSGKLTGTGYVVRTSSGLSDTDYPAPYRFAVPVASFKRQAMAQKSADELNRRRHNPRYSGDPRWLTAQYGGRCAQCGREVSPGEEIFYYPRGKKVFCSDEGCGRQRSRDFASEAFDEEVYAGGMNPKSSLTREQVAAKQAKAVRFLRDVVKDSDKADEIEGLTLEEYASKKKVALSNPSGRVNPTEEIHDDKGRTWRVDWKWENADQLWSAIATARRGRQVRARGRSENEAYDNLLEKLMPSRGRDNPKGRGRIDSIYSKAVSLGYPYPDTMHGRESTARPGVWMGRFTKDAARQGPAVWVGWDEKTRQYVVEHDNPGRRALTIPEKHELRIAEQTLRMSDAMVGVMGGPSKEQARETILRLTGRRPKENPLISGSRPAEPGEPKEFYYRDSQGVQWKLRLTPIYRHDYQEDTDTRDRSDKLTMIGWGASAWPALGSKGVPIERLTIYHPDRLAPYSGEERARTEAGALKVLKGLLAHKKNPRRGNPYTADDPQINRLLAVWHESQRADFERMYPHVDYDEAQAKWATDRAKYIALDEGRSPHRAGRFLIDKQTGMVYNIKAYGVPNKRQPAGTVEQMIAHYEQRRPYSGGGSRLRFNPETISIRGVAHEVVERKTPEQVAIEHPHLAAEMRKNKIVAHLVLKSPRGKLRAGYLFPSGRVSLYFPPGVRNPEGSEVAAAGLYESFHGKPPDEVLEFEAPSPHGGDYAALGQLRELHTDLPDGNRLDLIFTNADDVLLASNATNGSLGTQLYAIAGNQNLDAMLRDVKDAQKDKLNLGRIRSITYRAQKNFDDYVTTDYVHKFGEGGTQKPVLLYDRLGQRIEFAGGEYEIKQPGIMG